MILLLARLPAMVGHETEIALELHRLIFVLKS